MVECELCGKRMKMRINGSHLKRKHDINLNEYKELFPNTDCGRYKVSDFNCKLCDDVISGNSATKEKHIRTKHKLTVDDYNIKCNKIECECGCGNIPNYSYIRHKYNRFCGNHSIVWNKGLTRETDDRVNSMKSGGWNKGLTKDDDITIMKQSKGLSEFWKNNPDVKNQMLENQQKYSKNFKDYIFPSGKKVRIQGYENIALDLLLENYDESELITDRKNIPHIQYNDNRRYIPDIFIPNENRFIEVKSTWTYDTNEDIIETKCLATVSAGYKIDVWILDKKTKSIVKEYNYD